MRSLARSAAFCRLRCRRTMKKTRVPTIRNSLSVVSNVTDHQDTVGGVCLARKGSATCPTTDQGYLRQADDQRNARLGEFADISFAPIKGGILILAFLAFPIDAVQILHHDGVCRSEWCRQRQMEMALQEEKKKSEVASASTAQQRCMAGYWVIGSL